MTETIAKLPEKIRPAAVETATDEAIANYLRYTARIAEIAALAERDAIVLKTCEKLGIVVSDEELQAAGDAFRRERKLLSTAATLAWLQEEKMSPEDWTRGIQMKLLTRKLKDRLFLEAIDGHYLAHREEYRRVAFSQILVTELPEALEIVRTLQEGKASFAALAIEYSKARPSSEHGGFVGIRFLVNLMPEIKEALAASPEGEIVPPVKTALGYHILRVEKWFPACLNESVREEVSRVLFETWLKE